MEDVPAPRVLSGIQPTADSFHLGNLLGALDAVLTSESAGASGT